MSMPSTPSSPAAPGAGPSRSVGPSAGPAPKPKRSFGRRKVCRFCADKSLRIEYKDPRTLKYFTTERGKIIPRRISGNCARHQRSITTAIKRARHIALLPFTQSMT